MTEQLEEPVERESDDYALDSDQVQAVLTAIHDGDAHTLGRLLEQLHPADIADLMEQVGDNARRLLLRFWGSEIDGEVLSELDEGLRDEVIAALPAEVISEAVRDLESDDVVDLVEDLDEPQQEMVLEALEASDRAAVEQALSYPEFSAGRLMQREVVHAPEHWTVGRTIDFLRSDDSELPDQFYHVILTDPGCALWAMSPWARSSAPHATWP